MKKYKLYVDDKEYIVEVDNSSPSMIKVRVNGREYVVRREDVPSTPKPKGGSPTATAPPSQPQVNVKEKTQPVLEPDLVGFELVKAPMPGKIMAIGVAMGDRVHYGDALCTLEAMKMESVIRAPVNGTVHELRVQVGDTVQYDDVLVVLHKITD